MQAVICLFVLAAIFQVISSQGPPQPPDFAIPQNVPQECIKPPMGVEKPHECCQIPPFYNEEDFADCGIEKMKDGGPPSHGPKHGPPDCSKQNCMLKKKNFLKEDNTVNYEVMRAGISDWGKDNPAFQSAIDILIKLCLQDEGAPGPPHICEANRVMFCSTAVLFSNCPSNSWQPTEGCKNLKEHMDKCAPKF